MHSELFSGRSFASFPLIIFLISLLGFWTVTEFSTLAAESLIRGLSALGVFLGLSVGSIGFSSSDAMKNVLGPTNFLVYSSRTLPISRGKLLAAFIVKDLIYYTGLFLLPLGLGAVMIAGTAAFRGSVLMFGGFITGLLAAVLFARGSMRFSGFRLGYIQRLKPLVSKTLIDVSRSAGGFLKILFSLGILTAFYWFTVLYFPFTSSLLRNPVLSFSVLIGVVSLTVYNWINRFDTPEDYTHLPLDSSDLMRAKQRSFLLISLPATGILLGISFYLYPTSLIKGLTAVAAAISTQLFTLGLTSHLTGLEPNSRLFDSRVFVKYLLLNSVIVLPLLGISVFYRPDLQFLFVILLLAAAVSGVALSRRSRNKLEKVS